ncbi:MAG: two-component regulator propeller domain-containing protein [Gracilimonas sp.]
MIKKLFSLSILLAYSVVVYSQEFDSWKVYPSFSTVNSITIDGEIVYNATLGGIFSVNDDEVQSQITTMEGIYRSNPENIIIDKSNNKLIAGYIDGIIDVIDTETNEIQRLEDIFRVSRFTSKSINGFIIYDDQLYVATSFGIVVYDLKSLLVVDSYLKLGSFDIGTQVNEIDISNDSIFVATTQGVAFGSLNHNLVESSYWTNHTEDSGLPSNVIRDIKEFDGTIYVLIDGSIYNLVNGNWVLNNTFPNSGNTSIQRNSNSQTLGVATNTSITLIDIQDNVESLTPTMESSITTFKLDNDQIFVGTSNEGLIKYSNIIDDPTNTLPTGPYLNFFSKTLADDETLLATSTSAFPGSDPFNVIRGYYLYSDGIWKNFNRNTNNELFSFIIAYSLGMNDSSYYVGSWGYGIVKHNKSTDDITWYNRNNSNLLGLSSSPNYVVISGLDSDSQNNMWAVSYRSEFPLYVQMNGTDDWIPFQGLSGDDNYFNLFVDSYDQKWISLITNTNSGLGLLVVDTGNPEDPDDDNFVKLTSSQTNGNLPDEKINAIIQDKNEEVWIGTGRGIARFIFPELIVSGGPAERQSQWLISEDTAAVSRFLLRDVDVTAMAVNDANEKWIGSRNQGLWLLNEEGSRIEKRFTTENSSLISNNIESISINNQTGEVYISTDLGLVSYQDIPKIPVNEMDKLKVFPNPFQYSRHNQIVIEGLSNTTRIKILGVDGFVVNELSSQGGRISWDGYDYNGNRLGTGVYFVVAFEENGREKGIGKVVIVK